MSAYKRGGAGAWRRFLLLAAVAVVSLALSVTALGASDTTVRYTGHGTGTMKATLSLKARGPEVISYRVDIETLCGKIHGPAGRTDYWPVTSSGTKPARIGRSRSFMATQSAKTTIPPIPGVTSASSSGRYQFALDGRLNKTGTTIAGHVTLHITTSSGYYCLARKVPYTAHRRTIEKHAR